MDGFVPDKNDIFPGASHLLQRHKCRQAGGRSIVPYHLPVRHSRHECERRGAIKIISLYKGVFLVTLLCNRKKPGLKKRINIRFPLVGIILLVAVTAAYSQKVVRASEDFYHLKTGGSLNQNCITSFAHDTLGQMWISTKDGVIRYNAKRMFVYKKGLGDKAIGDNFIPAVYKARNGELWIVSQKAPAGMMPVKTFSCGPETNAFARAT